MLTKTKMQEIQDLKLQGYTKADIIRYYEAQGRKLIIPGLFEPPVRTLRATIPENESHIFR